MNLPVTIEHRTVTHLTRFGRTTAIVHLEGLGEHGYGEEVTFQAADLLPAGARTPWRYSGAFDGFALGLFERAPEYDVVRHYRRWAFEAAALDLALRQAGLRFDEMVGRTPAPVEFVVSNGLPAGARLKIDATELRPGLPVDVIDFKGLGDRAAVERALELYPDALLEDPQVVVPGARISWDTRITSAAEVPRLPA